MREDVLLVISQIYDASIDPTLWKSALIQIAAFVGATRATIAIEDAHAKHMPSVFMSYDDPAWIESYFRVISLNPTRIAVAAYAKPGDIILVTDIMSQHEYEKTRYYKEWLQERDIVDNTVAIIDRSTTDFTVLALHRDSKLGPADEIVRERLAMILPHLMRAVAIGRVLERTKLEALTFAEVLDRMESAILLVDHSGRVVQANASARHHLGTGTVLRTAQGVLRMQDAEATIALDEAIASATDRVTASIPNVLSIAARSSSGDRYIANFLPLTSGNRSEIGNYFHAVIAVFVRRIGLDLSIDPIPLAHSYDLTPRELTVMVTVVQNGGVLEAAAILGLSANTVRSHLQSIYRKTGAQNQSELSKLVASAGTGLI